MSNAQLSVKVVGSMNWDSINQVSSHYPGRQHNSVQNPVDIEDCPGGHGVNQAIAVYRASHQSSFSLPNVEGLYEDIQVYMIGMIGEDEDKRGKKIKDALADNGIHVGGVHLAQKVRTGYANVAVDARGDPRITNYSFANKYLTWDLVEQELGKSPRADLILVQLEIPQDTVVKTIEYANKNQIPIIFNSAPTSSQPRNLYSHRFIFQVDHLILNHHCVKEICETPSPGDEHSLDDGMTSVSKIQESYSKYFEHFHSHGARCVVITLGHRGVIASYLEPPDASDNSGQRIFFIPAKKRQPHPVDETGASDAFIGAYAVEVLKQMKTPSNRDLRPRSLDLDIGRAIEDGIKAGSLTTEHFGSFPAIPWRQQWIGPEVSWLTANPFRSL
uniref:WGS project CBMI000000000 data, contig CS3069_c001088 n=1 Tax=Fusarium clavum TaxID=2594811 RepID=A0A090MHH4_9HYPO|nr:unnamed protein product [Fusarium clavum]CEG05753.1 unnamed protein product [Fusarium clavum]